MNFCKYYKQKEIVSYDSGTTWQDVIPYVYQVGELYEIDSPDCTSGEPVIRWTLVPGDYLCEGKDKYEKEIEEYSIDGVVWKAVYPTTYRKGRLLEIYSDICDNKWEGHYNDNTTYDPTVTPIECPAWHKWVPYVGCVYVDPIKFVRCSTSTSTTLTRGEVTYNPYYLIYGYVGDCVETIGNGAFSGMTELTDIYFTDDWVLNIGNDAFKDCVNLERITLPAKLEHMGSGAFENCSGLTSVDIGDKLLAISSHTFSNCINLTDISTPVRCADIGEYAFAGCKRLSGVTLADGVKPYTGGLAFIYEGAFSGCTSLSSITIPNNVLTIDDLAFADCSALTDVHIGIRVSNISNNAFSGCSNFRNLYIDASTIGNWFSGITSINNIIIEDNVTTIGNYAFYECSGVTSCTIGSGVTSIGNSAFRHVRNLPNINIPSGVTSIGTSAFTNCHDLQSIVIPSGVTSIQNGTFYQCGSLSSVTFNSITPPTLGNNVFESTQIASGNGVIYVPCDSFADYITASGFSRYARQIRGIPPCELPIKYKATYVDLSTYETYCLGSSNSISTADTRPTGYAVTAMTSAEIDEDCTVQNIMNGAFSGCTSLSSVTIPDSVGWIWESAFENCNHLTSIDIPDSVTNIRGSAFKYCTGLTSVHIGSGVTFIGQDAFRYCTNLTGITIDAVTPPSLSSSGGVFDNTNNCPIYVPCNSLTSYRTASGWTSYTTRLRGIQPCDYKFTALFTWGTEYTLPCNSSSTLSAGETNISGYTNINTVFIGNCVTEIGGSAFGGFTSLSSVDIPNSVTILGSRAFSGCTSLSSLIIPSSVTSIGVYAFAGCAITSITIPNSVTSIGDSAFQQCSGLKSANLGNGISIIPTNAFEYCTGLTTISIPSSITRIDSGAFYECRRLSSVTIPSGVTKIGFDAFRNCSGLTSIVVDRNTPPTLGNNYVFNGSNCPIYVPCGYANTYKNASRWSNYASRIVDDCPQYRTVSAALTCVGYDKHYLDEYQVSYDGGTTWTTLSSSTGSLIEVDSEYCGYVPPIFDGKFKATYSGGTTYSAECDSSTELTTATTKPSGYEYSAMTRAKIGDCITIISGSAFRNCSRLTSVNIPNSVETIYSYAFANCSSLTNIEIPSSVTFIGYRVFNYCSGLLSITVNSSTPPELDSFGGYDVFGYTNNCPIYVPATSVNTFKSAPGWSNYASRIQPIP